jgi:acylphosphatase
LRHGVEGYVRNLDDGDVEIWAQADEKTLALFRAAVERGPRGSRVDGVAAKPVAVDESLSSFRVRF